MRYNIYCNKKNLSKNHKAAIAEFEKRLGSYCDITKSMTTTLSLPKEIIKENHHIIFLCDGPSTYSSDEFARYLQCLFLKGASVFHVLIGFSQAEAYKAVLSVSKEAAPDHLSLSRSSLSTETATLLFYEQLYRAYTILQGKTYHK
ncbi:MAG: 23S rRNA (pseudouridine(1915)-N(3))-methyltransferase RlmH [Clostridium sp.]|nr:23S rRNA (pseudouridine(1915)-N(3))-methyltransferase RlmH [Clostridium sp.]